MKRVTFNLVLLLLSCVLLAGTAFAAKTSKSSQGDSWQSIAKLPNWSGTWDPMFPPPPNEPPALTPEYAARLEAKKAAVEKGGGQSQYGANCLPPGMPSIMNNPYPVEFLFTPGKVTIAIEIYSQMRRIYTDGRAHPENLEPSFNGHSIGHWEGDTLVIDTVGLVPHTPLDFLGDLSSFIEMEHSDQMHVVERIRLTGPDTLSITTTVTDPKALTKPWTYTRISTRNRQWDIQEYVCEQNNRLSVDESGHPNYNLNR